MGSTKGDRASDDESRAATDTGDGAEHGGATDGRANGHGAPTDPPWSAPEFAPARGPDPAATVGGEPDTARPDPTGQQSPAVADHAAPVAVPGGSSPAGAGRQAPDDPGPPAAWSEHPAAPYPQGGPPGSPAAVGAHSAGSHPAGANPAGPYPPGPYPHGPYPPPPTGWAPPPPPGRTPARTHQWGLGAFFVVFGAFLLVSVLIGVVAMPADGALTVPVVLLSLLVPPIVAAAVAVVITRVRGNGPGADLGLVWSWRDLGLGLAFGFGGLFLTGIAAAVFVAIVGPDVSTAVGDAFAGLRAGPAAAILVLAAVVLVVPLCEEILFRGMLWGAVERLGANRWIAFGITTVIFALFHFEFTRAPLLLVISIPIGLARVYTGRLLASIVAHQVNNLLPGLVLAAGMLGLLPTL